MLLQRERASTNHRYHLTYYQYTLEMHYVHILLIGFVAMYPMFLIIVAMLFTLLPRCFLFPSARLTQLLLEVDLLGNIIRQIGLRIHSHD